MDPVTELGPFSAPEAAAISWPTTVDLIDRAQLFWLSTVRPDGRPHVTPLIAARALGGLCFTTGGHERKARNLDENPRCVLTTGINDLAHPDVVVEGDAAVVTDEADRRRAMDDFELKYGWHVTSAEGNWHFLVEAVMSGDVRLYRVGPTTAFTFGKGRVFSETRHRFPSD